MKAITTGVKKCLDRRLFDGIASPANHLRRREFLIESSRAALGFSLLSIAGCSTVKQKKKSGGQRDTFLESRIAEWKRGIPQWLQDAKLPGVSMLLINDGKLSWRQEFGVKDAVSKEPVNSETVFAACSNTKPVFAYAVVKLCEEGVMDLDTPLTKYTSKRFIEGDPRLDLITARHVLTHSTGFPNWRNGQQPLAIQFTPGTKRQYSGEGFYYLQSVVEEVTRQPFAEFMQVNILEPFGMMSSRFDWDETYARRIAKPHDQNGKRIETKPKIASEMAADLAVYGAAASLHTTPTDYAKFILEILNPKPSDAFRLNENSWREYLRPQLKRDEITSSSLGWIVGHFNGLTSFTHAGSDAGWNCDATASIDRKSGIIIMANGDNFPPFREKLRLDLEFFTHLFRA